MVDSIMALTWPLLYDQVESDELILFQNGVTYQSMYFYGYIICRTCHLNYFMWICVINIVLMINIGKKALSNPFCIAVLSHTTNCVILQSKTSFLYFPFWNLLTSVSLKITINCSDSLFSVLLLLGYLNSITSLFKKSHFRKHIIFSRCKMYYSTLLVLISP